MDWILVRDVIVSVLMIVGCLMSLGAAIGLLRFGDILSRMHAATKPQVLGLACLLAAVAVHQSMWSWLPILVLIFVLQALTAPVSAHMVGRAAYRSKHLDSGTLVSDDLAEVVQYAEEAAGKSEAPKK
ncbi:MAG: monovalent cation/H(+) antiporter subunit G [Galactobacter sp.]|uniref:monovalent cation/H(+) antiporter subunit G n=1 Tax=Galactobacter sp. TaxID=2676125 RepID=UPI0025BD50F3|nr:monovalent cation/H(+) antiporter subunit G [Galactobacter sp.]